MKGWGCAVGVSAAAAAAEVVALECFVWTIDRLLRGQKVYAPLPPFVDTGPVALHDDLLDVMAGSPLAFCSH